MHIGPGDALLIVDVQRDFLPGGALGVPRGDRIVPALNHYLATWRARGLPVFLSRDWHPAGHCSFRERGGPWLPHCVAHTPGAEFAPGLAVPPSATVVSKGAGVDRDAYSAFQGTDLEEQLARAGVRRLFVGGLATDYCVLETVRDARARGYAVFVLADAIRAIDAEPGDGPRAEAEMAHLGAVSIDAGALAG